MDIWNSTDYPLSPPLLMDFQGMILASFNIHSTVECSSDTSDYLSKLSDLFCTKCIILARIKGSTYCRDCYLIISGNFQRELKLNFERGTTVWGACGAVLNEQHWFIGGYNERRQVSHRP